MKLLDLLHSDVRKPARYRGGEFFPGGFTAPEPGDLKVALVYPDTYEIGMSNTGLRILYSLLTRMEGVFVDLAFTPWPDMEAALRRSGERLTSRGANLPLADFDLLGVSLQFELNYSNILTVLDLAGLPLHSKERTRSHPLVIAGGPCATHCEPLAPFFDAVLPGDGEEALSRFIEALRTHGKEPRDSLLARLDTMPSVYVPSLHTPVPGPGGTLVLPGLAIAKETLRELDGFGAFTEFPVPAVETVFDRVSLELARGCHQGCRFCEQGFTYRPPRERSLDYLMGWARETIRSTGLTEVSMASLSSADYSCILPLADEIRQLARDHDASVAVSSLRAYGIDDAVLDALTDRRTSSLTMAPEAGSQRLRNLINKNVTRDQLLDAVRRIVDKRINRIKFYFMLGLPTETETDMEELATLVHDCYDIVRGRFKGKAAVVASTSMFVPRPHTPFQWAGMASITELDAKVQFLRDRFRRKGITYKWHDPRMSWLEAVITRGDRSLAAVIETAWRDGARFDSWDEQFRMDLWQGALQKCGIDGDIFLAHRELDDLLPWSHFKIDVDDDFMRREYLRALEFKTTKPCQPFGDRFSCYQCGANCVAPEPAAAPVPAPEPPPVVSIPDSGQKTPTAPPTRYRLIYRKTGDAVLLGHLDILRQMTLAMRRAGIAVERSHGFNPRPRFYFAAPLALGHFALAEPVDVSIHGTLAESEALELLNNCSIPGLDFTSWVEVTEEMPKVARIKGVTFLLAPAPGSLDAQALADQMVALESEHLVAAAVATDLPEALPHAPRGAVRVHWEANAPRVDKVLAETLPELTWHWICREELTY